MKRREFTQGAMACALGHGLPRGVSAEDTVAIKNLDRFGGWKGK